MNHSGNLNNLRKNAETPNDFCENQGQVDDRSVDEILENITSTPIGKLLKTIASLPEIRQEKVLDVRHQLSRGKYNLHKRLNVALDKVLEELVN